MLYCFVPAIVFNNAHAIVRCATIARSIPDYYLALVKPGERIPADDVVHEGQ